MELNENANLDTSQVEDLRGSTGGGGGFGRGGGGGIPIPLPSGGGGWIGLILTIVVLGIAGTLGLSVLFNRLSSRSVLQNALLAVVSLAALAATLLGIISLMSRTD